MTYSNEKNPHIKRVPCAETNGGQIPEDCVECTVFVPHPAGYPTVVKSCLFEHMADAWKAGYQQAEKDKELTVEEKDLLLWFRSSVALTEEEKEIFDNIKKKVIKGD